jgi:hypothetical protein
MKQLDIFPEPNQRPTFPPMPRTTRQQLLRLMARVLLDIVCPRQDHDQGEQRDE